MFFLSRCVKSNRGLAASSIDDELSRAKERISGEAARVSRSFTFKTLTRSEVRLGGKRNED